MNNNKTKFDQNAPDCQSSERRSFLGKSVMAAGAVAAVPVIAGAPQAADAAVIKKIDMGSRAANRRSRAFDLRYDAAVAQANIPLPAHPDNRDEANYSKKIGSFTKALPHNEYGEVDIKAFRQLIRALRFGKNDYYEAIPMGGARKLANPQAAYMYSLEGADCHALAMPPAPAFSSEDEIAEIVEVYWHALLRDVPFSDYATHPLAAAAVADLNRFAFFQNRFPGGVTTENLFRGETQGDLVGPYISQLLLKDVPFGAKAVTQTYDIDIAGLDFMGSYEEWLDVQRGNVPGASVFDSSQRFIGDGRALGSYVHTDFSYQAYLCAAQIIAGGLGINPWAPNLPYVGSATQGAFVSFGGPDLLSLIAKAAHEGLKAAWFQKWQVHLRLRPETFGGRLHNHLTGARNYPIDASIYDVNVFEETRARTGTYLLPMAYPEGSPTHPAYPAGHAVIAGACTTVMKAFFNNDAVIPDPVMAANNGLNLQSYTGDDLTIGGELNKLAANIALGRDIAGVHWRTDGVDGLKLGEQVAIRILADIKRVYIESFDGFTFRGFDDTTINV
ncbi:MAG: vanadium-dependent haloperoxidase [Pseudomonadota bacterium]